MNLKETFAPLAAALAIGAASQRCSEYEYIYPDAGDAAVVTDAGGDTAGGDAENDGSTDTTQPDNGSDQEIIAGEDAGPPPPSGTPVTPPGLDEKPCQNNSMPQGTEAPQRINLYSDNQFAAMRMFLGDKNGNGAKKGLAEKDDAVGGYTLPEDMAKLPDVHSPDNILFKEAGGGVMLFVTPSPEMLDLGADNGEKQLKDTARWTNSREKGNPANETFEWPTTVYVQDSSKAPKNEEEVRTMLTQLGEAIRKQDANLHGSVMAKYGLTKQYTTSGNYNDMFRATLGEGFNVITFIAVPACEGTIDTSQANTRKDLENAFANAYQLPKQKLELQQAA